MDWKCSHAVCSWLCALGRSKAVWSETAGDPFLHLSLDSWHNAHWSGAGAQTHRSSVVLEPGLLEQTSSQMYSKSHTAERCPNRNVSGYLCLVTERSARVTVGKKSNYSLLVVYLTETIETTRAGTGFFGLRSQPQPFIPARPSKTCLIFWLS